MSSIKISHVKLSTLPPLFFFFFLNGGMVLEGYGRRKPQTFLCVLILARCVGKITFKYRMKKCGPSESVPIWAIDISKTVE